MQALSTLFSKHGYCEAMKKDAVDKSVGRPSSQERTAFGEQLYSARTKLGLSQAEVAGKLGITQAAYADWERYPVALRPDQIESVASILDIPVKRLFDKASPQNDLPPKSKPTVRLRKIYHQAGRLPNEAQNRVAEVVEALVEKHAKAS